MVARRGFGLLTSSNFYVPQVPVPGSMATFVTPAAVTAALLPYTNAAMTTNGGRSTRGLVAIVPATRKRSRGIGQDSTDMSTIDFGTAPTIDTSSSTPAVDWSTVLAGTSSGPTYGSVTIPSLPSPGYIQVPAMTTADVMAGAGFTSSETFERASGPPFHKGYFVPHDSYTPAVFRSRTNRSNASW